MYETTATVLLGGRSASRRRAHGTRHPVGELCVSGCRPCARHNCCGARSEWIGRRSGDVLRPENHSPHSMMDSCVSRILRKSQKTVSREWFRVATRVLSLRFRTALSSDRVTIAFDTYAPKRECGAMAGLALDHVRV
jgi:hypothetical protein